ncbi:PD-(D/E)XK nuclease family protein [Pontibacter sp. BAB1700]|uniref:PDDEXK-like family protein n=1 Tax=Pontibacter sp. BAB1700 TaxID=1144253 RepID=UPI00026BC981|nr:PD-(D/E)XK nuclease family protein [Pontibacter sp. BAB1700]EJF10589.1 hypothetical protein O71_08118 [Pontibacter sp. BAB1700]
MEMIDNQTKTSFELGNYFSILDTKVKLADEVRKSYGKELSPAFNSFDFWKTDENKVSEILAFFLNPTERHEQGDVYLRHFLKKFNLDFFNFNTEDKISVLCELPTNAGRRIDIAIIKNDFEQVIGIENKVRHNTQDQANQVKDYLLYLEQKSGGNYCLLYLSPQSKDLSDGSLHPSERVSYIEQRRLQLINYEEHIIECVGEFSQLSENNRVRAFLKDFERKLSSMYRGESDLNRKQVAVDHIKANPHNLELSFLVANSLQDVKRELREKFDQQLVEIGQELGIAVDSQNQRLTPSNWKNHQIIFNYESGGLLFGVIRRSEDKTLTRLPEINNLLEEQIKMKFKVSPYWALWQYFYENVENNTDFWLDIYKGEAKKRAREFVKLINDNFNTAEY